ncbi:MAG: hypothetical protein OXR73_17775 [Myxococcales bacterium]|nr:hypothetical protein [Myxococcales bacterium]
MRLFAAIGCSLVLWTTAPSGFVCAQDTEEDVDHATSLHEQLVEIRFRPTGFAQIAVWLEDGEGRFLTTVGLTEATARRGIGNRPGASQMNSGFRWPYGRREGVLPTWARRRATADGASKWRRVIFQDRSSEGLASRTSTDFSPDNYFCLSFDRKHASKEALDAVSCASVFNSDKGRFMTGRDVDGGYAEPYEDLTTRVGRMEPLSEYSLYPPRMDVKPCRGQPGCNDHADVLDFEDHARDVMPEIDAVTMPTPQGDADKRLLFTAPQDWPAGDYRACVEINVEGDYNDVYNPDVLPTPQTPDETWDTWARTYGYPYRGQPSVVYCTPFELGADGAQTFTVRDPEGSVSTWDTTAPDYGELYGMEGMTDDPIDAPGVGADRLRAMSDGERLHVIVIPPLSCEGNVPPGPVADVQVAHHGDTLHAHEWAQLRFEAAKDDRGIFRYDVRVSTDPIDDERSFMRAERAKEATIAAQELVIPTDVAAGDMVHVDVGGLTQSTRYYVAVRAVDECAKSGEFGVAEFQTPVRTFTTVTPCFVATAAYGSPLAAEIGVLRRYRDRYLQNHALGRVLVDAYYAFGPGLANLVSQDEELRAATRWALGPVVWLLEALDI